MPVKKAPFLLSVFLVLNIIGGLFSGCTAEKSPELQVATSTSLLQYIVQQVGNDNVEVFNLVPPNQHPGNFDAKPGDIQQLSQANLFLLHGWPGEGYADKLIASVNNPDLTVVKASVDGNWMIPSVQTAATDKIAGVLSEIDTKNASKYQQSAEVYKKRIQATENDITQKLAEANVSAVKVIASARQADFLQWAGFDVIATFNSAQDLTPQKVKDLVDQGRTSGVSLIVNNIQDGQDAGIAIARELGVASVNLSNFPGGFDDTETWEKAIGCNINILIDAIAQMK
jgi:zinc transport system substrate-binding protein